jgi:hypothetical protein
MWILASFPAPATRLTEGSIKGRGPRKEGAGRRVLRTRKLLILGGNRTMQNSQNPPMWARVGHVETGDRIVLSSSQHTSLRDITFVPEPSPQIREVAQSVACC